MDTRFLRFGTALCKLGQLAAHHHRTYDPAMFLVTESDAAAIQCRLRVAGCEFQAPQKGRRLINV